MKQRFGAILCVILGAILIFSGISTTSASGGVEIPTTCSPSVGAVAGCPTGQLVISETSTGSTAKPASWTYTIASDNCTLPAASSATVTVNDGDSATSDDLYVFTGSANSDSAKCEYTLTETPFQDFVATYDPDQPYTLPGVIRTAGGVRARPHLASDQTGVSVTNTSPTVTSSAPASSTPASSTAPRSTAATSTAASSSAAPISDTASGLPLSTTTAAQSSAAAGALANTGPARRVSTTLLAGIALCLFGFVLLFAGRRPRAARRR